MCKYSSSRYSRRFSGVRDFIVERPGNAIDYEEINITVFPGLPTSIYDSITCANFGLPM